MIGISEQLNSVQEPHKQNYSHLAAQCLQQHLEVWSKKAKILPFRNAKVCLSRMFYLKAYGVNEDERGLYVFSTLHI